LLDSLLQENVIVIFLVIMVSTVDELW